MNVAGQGGDQKNGYPDGSRQDEAADDQSLLDSIVSVFGSNESPAAKDQSGQPQATVNEEPGTGQQGEAADAPADVVNMAEEDRRRFGLSDPDRQAAEDPSSIDLGWGERLDGTFKGNGYFGPQKMTDGSGTVATEISIGVEFDGVETLIPTMVPTLTRKELDFLLGGGRPTDQIVKKAVEFARQRIEKGLSPFAAFGEQYPLPDEYKPADWNEKAPPSEMFLEGEIRAEQSREDELQARYKAVWDNVVNMVGEPTAKIIKRAIETSVAEKLAAINEPPDPKEVQALVEAGQPFAGHPDFTPREAAEWGRPGLGPLPEAADLLGEQMNDLTAAFEGVLDKPYEQISRPPFGETRDEAMSRWLNDAIQKAPALRKTAAKVLEEGRGDSREKAIIRTRAKLAIDLANRIDAVTRHPDFMTPSDIWKARGERERERIMSDWKALVKAIKRWIEKRKQMVREQEWATNVSTPKY